MAGLTLSNAPDRHLRIVGGERERVGLWMLDRIPDVMELPGGFEAIGVARGGQLVGGCLYSNYTPYRDGGVIQIWAAGEGAWLSRRVIRVMFDYPFNQLRCNRLTALTAKSNKPSRKLLEGLGFKLEGIARQGFGPRSHACIYGLLRSEQGWV